MEMDDSEDAQLTGSLNEDHKQNSNGLLADSKSRGFTTSLSDSFALPKASDVTSGENRSVTCDSLPRAAGATREGPVEKDQPSVRKRRKTPPPEVAAEPKTETGSGALADGSEGSHTLGGSSDSADTVKTEICFRVVAPSSQVRHSWSVAGAVAAKAPRPSIIKRPSSSVVGDAATATATTAAAAADGKRKAPTTYDTSDGQEVATRRQPCKGAGEKPAASRDRRVSIQETSDHSAPAPSRQSPRVKDVALRLPPATVPDPQDKQASYLLLCVVYQRLCFQTVRMNVNADQSRFFL